MFRFRRLIAVLALLSCLFAGLNGFAEESDTGVQLSAAQQPQKTAGDAVPDDAPVQKNTEETVRPEAVPDNGGALQDTPAEDPFLSLSSPPSPLRRRKRAATPVFTALCRP